jgi:DNA repair photolyase
MPFRPIYPPRTRAKEYSDLAINTCHGCDHGCHYCYARGMFKRFHPKENFEDAKYKEGIVEAVKNQLSGGKYKGKKILLSFMGDAYCANIGTIKTREIMMAIKAAGANFSILTKGGVRANRDFDLYGPGDSFGSTLTFTSTDDSRKWEPNAAIPMNRIAALNFAHSRGIKTWVSMEPVIDPEQTLELIELTHEFVDLYKVGKLNSDNCRGSEYYEELKQIERTIDWKGFGERAEALLKGYEKEYYIKEDLRRCMNK